MEKYEVALLNLTKTKKSSRLFMQMKQKHAIQMIFQQSNNRSCLDRIGLHCYNISKIQGGIFHEFIW